MSFIDYHNKTLRLFGYCIPEDLPNGVLPAVSVLGKIAVYTKFLSIEEVNMAVLQALTLETVVQYYTLSKTEPVCLQVEFRLGLLIELRGVRQPEEDAV